MTHEADSAPDLTGAVPDIIRRHSLYAAGGALIPIPMIEVLTSTSSQLHMISELCELYGIRFSDQAVKASLVTFAGLVVPAGKIGASAYLMARAVPVVGPVLGLATAPVLAGAMTWATGRVFAWHFERGGTLGDFDAEDAVARFKREFSQGKRRIRGQLGRGAAAKA